LDRLPESVTGIAPGKLSAGGRGYPDWIENYIGEVIELSPLCIMIGCAIYQIIRHALNNNLVSKILITF